MTSLMILIYIAAVGVAVAFQRQSKRQKAEIALTCARLGLELPPSRPKVRTLEALLNIAIGIVLLIPGASGFRLMLQDPAVRVQTGERMIDFYAVLIAAGLTLIVLGGAALRANIIYRRARAHSGGDTAPPGPAQ